MTETELRWLRHGQPMPDGWRYAEQGASHHLQHAVLIERIPAHDEAAVAAYADELKRTPVSPAVLGD